MKNKPYSMIEKCRECGSILHIVRKRYCCDIDYLQESLDNSDQGSPLWAPFLLRINEEGIKHEIVIKKAIVQSEKDKIKSLKAEQKIAKKKRHKKYRMDSELKESILKRDKHKCAECGSKKGLHIHHKTHRENGGSDDPVNLITLCELCHAEEHRGEPVYNIMIKKLWEYQEISEHVH